MQRFHQMTVSFKKWPGEQGIGLTPLSDGLLEHTHYEAAFRNATCVVRLEIERGRCIEATVKAIPGGPPITTDTMRLPVNEMIRRSAVIAVTREGEFVMGGEVRAAWDERKRRGRRHKLDAVFLGKVATEYRRALAAGEHPTAAVGKLIGRPPTTAARWVTAARRAGLLGPTKRGAKGEAPPFA